MKDIVDVYIDLIENHTQIVNVTIKWKPKLGFNTFAFPKWTPGSYTIRDHAKNIVGLELTQESLILDLKRISIDKWEFFAECNNYLTLKYQVEAKELTVRTSYLDSQYASLCLASIVMLVPEQRYSEHVTRLLLPSNWNIYIPGCNQLPYICSNYDELIDTPVHAGNLKSELFYVNKHKHEIVYVGCLPFELPDTFLKDVERICEKCCQMMSTSPPALDSYQFILHLYDNGYGGLEHDNSSVLHYNWDSLSKQNGYRKLLQLIGHEYLHQWNIRRLRPLEYIEYDYSREVISESLWFAEGVTSYFDITLPYLVDISNLDDLLIDFTDELNTLFIDSGINYHSLSQSSIEAWIKLYKATPKTINRQVSYYKLGAAMALCLDIELRKYSASLSTLLRDLWTAYGAKNIGYTRSDIINVIYKYNCHIINDINKWLDKPGSIPISEKVKDIGLHFNPIYEKFRFSGIVINETDNRLIITNIILGSPAEKAGLVADDEIIAIDDYRVTTIQNFCRHFVKKLELEVTYSRKGHINKAIVLTESPHVKQYKLQQIPNITNQQKSLQEKWLQFI